MQVDNLTDEEMTIMLAGAGFFLGFVMFVVLSRLVEEWVIACDRQDRERIREVLREMGIEPRMGEPAGEPVARPRTALVLTPRVTQ